jgi:3-hydroxymyristoyl/3-hydroxydecanoyl-(acyl carrier protein) dehydratase
MLPQVLTAARSALHFVNPSDPRMPGVLIQAQFATLASQQHFQQLMHSTAQAHPQAVLLPQHTYAAQ